MKANEKSRRWAPFGPGRRNNSNSKIVRRIQRTGQQRRRKARRGKEKVLVEIFSDGYIRVFGSDGVDAMAIIRPHVTSAKNAIRAEQLIESVLPKPFLLVYEANKLKTTALVEKITPTQIQERLWRTQFVEANKENKTPIPQILKRILEG